MSQLFAQGQKAILDIPKTLEYLETFGVPVVGFQTDEFPAFYSRTSGCKLEMRFDDSDSLAHFIQTKWKLGLAGGILVTNPIPEEFEIPSSEVSL